MLVRGAVSWLVLPPPSSGGRVRYKVTCSHWFNDAEAASLHRQQCVRLARVATLYFASLFMCEIYQLVFKHFWISDLWIVWCSWTKLGLK